jgi:hypothetical protein
MSAIVLDNKESYEQASGRNSQKQRKPIRQSQTQVHQVPKPTEWQQRVDDLPTALEAVRALESRYGPVQCCVVNVTRVNGAWLRRFGRLALIVGSPSSMIYVEFFRWGYAHKVPYGPAN